MELKIYLKLFSTITKELITCIIYVLLISCLFLIPSKSYAYSKTDYIVHSYWSESTQHISFSKHYYDYYLDVFNKELQFQFFIPTSTNPVSIMYKHKDMADWDTHEMQSPRTGKFTIQECFDKGLNILKIPSGYAYEGEYICVIDGYGIGPNDPNPEPDPDGILSPTEFDELFCGNSTIKDKLTYAYYPFEKAVDYSVRRSLTAGQVSGSGVLEIFSCPSTDENPDGVCTHDYFVNEARKYLPSIPAERVHCFESDMGGCSTYEVFAYCKTAIKQISTSDITSDAVDCRKTIYQFTGETGVGLDSPPVEYCYEDDKQDHTFKEWCELQFDDSSYWVGANLEEYCDPVGKDTSEEKVEEDGKCEITTETIDVGYSTTETSNQIIKDITKKIVVKDCDGTVISEKVIESQIIVDKDDILGDGSNADKKPCLVGPYCPPNSGTNEGTGSGVGENEAGSGSGSGNGSGNDWGDVGEVEDLSGWYVSKYPEGFEGILNKHMAVYNDGPLGQFIASLNPFGDGGKFPKFTIDLKIGDIIDFGEHTIDLENIPMGENRKLNLVALIRALLLIYASIYAFRQVF